LADQLLARSKLRQDGSGNRSRLARGVFTVPRGTGRYLPGLDGLRALAVLGVVAYHLQLSFAPGGLLGVDVFFVLSGYLITDLLVAEWRENGGIGLKNFWLRRARRLLPALFIMIIVVVDWVALYDHAQLPALRYDVVASIAYVSNWWFIFHHVSYFASFGPPSPFGHLWSLAVEGQFYLLWPLLLLLGLRYLPRRGLLVGLTLAGVAASALAMGFLYHPGSDPSRVYYGTDTRAFALLIGAALALVWPGQNLSGATSPRRRLGIDLAGCTGLIIVLVMMWRTNQYETFLYRGGLLLLSSAAAILVAALAHPASRLGRALGWEPLRWLGERSYGIYLWHYPVITLTSQVVNTSGVNAVRAVLQVAASITLAALSWRFVEEPIRHGALQKLWVMMRGGAPQLAVSGATCEAPDRKPGARLRARLLALWAQRRGPLVKTWAATAVAALVLGMFCLGIAGVIPGVTASSTGAGFAVPVSVPISEPIPAEAGNSTAVPAASQPGPEQPPIITGAAGPTGASPDAAMTGQGVTAIGDSVLVDVAPTLSKLLPGIVIDAAIGRQLIDTPAVVNHLKAEGKLSHRVIIELGTNGPFTTEQLVSLLDSLGSVQQVILVNTRVPRPWESAVNATLAQVAATRPVTTLVDWYAASAGHSSFFYPDGVHLNPAGSQVYATVVAKSVQPPRN
jgi:peptidoglycan/LPS O-acetylase OafA/YrhL